ncbi:MAG: sulfite exporter TauE/SafE family protein [Verrucomicrobia bacterium]|nr:sulfite exporter TauE/SafE family protein [Verrucomicrobiota bacterium]
MTEWVLAVASAFWLGVLTSISPCPMATNIAAISFVSRGMGRPRRALLSGLLYCIGRTLAYTALGVLLVLSLLSAPWLSHVLQKYMNALLGPVLILVGMVLLDLIAFTPRGRGVSGRMQERVTAAGPWGALFLGLLFALSFCPISAALFFGSLVPLAVKMHSGFLLPAAYGVATGLPVLVFGVLIALGAHRLAAAYNRLAVFERGARRITGIIFIVVGIYTALTQIFGVRLP